MHVNSKKTQTCVCPPYPSTLALYIHTGSIYPHWLVWTHREGTALKRNAYNVTWDEMLT